MPISGRSTKWTQSHPTKNNNKIHILILTCCDQVPRKNSDSNILTLISLNLSYKNACILNMWTGKSCISNMSARHCLVLWKLKLNFHLHINSEYNMAINVAHWKTINEEWKPSKFKYLTWTITDHLMQQDFNTMKQNGQFWFNIKSQ
jgi:hypothetical protein